MNKPIKEKVQQFVKGKREYTQKELDRVIEAIAKLQEEKVMLENTLHIQNHIINIKKLDAESSTSDTPRD